MALTGRVRPDDLQAILGVSSLQVIMLGTRLAELVLLEAHEEGHRRDVRDWRVCWIPQARQVAQRIIDKCTVCRRLEPKTGGQSMGMFPTFKMPA